MLEDLSSREITWQAEGAFMCEGRGGEVALACFNDNEKLVGWIGVSEEEGGRT